MKTISKPIRFELSVFLSCLLFWSLIYCSFILLIEMISMSIIVGVFLFSVSVLTYLFLWYTALPQPQSELVNEILGCDPKLMKCKKSTIESTFSATNIATTDEQLTDSDFYTVIGHRGAGLDAPENSLSAIRQCHEKGCQVVEFDVVLTADGVPVLFHDDTVDRLTHSSGLVHQMTWDQLKALDISEKHPLQKRFIGERVALFSDVVKLCLDLNIRMIIDIKSDSNKLIQVILDMFKEHPKLYKRAMVSAFNPLIIYMIRSRDPSIVCSMAWRPYSFSSSTYGLDSGLTRRYTNLFAHTTAHLADVVSAWMFHRVSWFLLGLSAVLLHKDAVSFELLSYLEKKNVRVVVWTVNRPQEKLYFSRVLKLAYITDTLTTEKNIPLF